ncbi:MAG: phosphatase PAP2 family protein [Candidatus Eisenbacteria bacterium]|uniref:Phosphatase PAP2 family protein n=1 Tax=Eiseniibacteriota bacterium TaxID=2212470 RepID=A0A937XAG1_UNCEI|nr:phosphatase PAP2 family protein [Candidatus Eisenbacteria bacterium]
MSGGRGHLPGDILALFYLGVTGLLVLVSPARSALLPGFIAAHFGLLGLTIALRWAPRDGNPWVRFLRYTYPLAALPFFYGGVQHLSRLVTSGYHDEAMIRLEAICFLCQPSQLLHQWLPWLPLSEFLHFTYALYILLVPIAALLLLGLRRHEALKLFTTSVLGTFFFCYLVFTFFPVKGPFEHIGPIDPAAKGMLFPQLVHGLLTRGSSIGTAFPSSHVAVAVTIWWVTRPYVGRWQILFLVAAAGIFAGTVYGGYHYALDSLAGLAVGVAGGIFWPRAHGWLCRRLDRSASGHGRPGVRASGPEEAEEEMRARA